MGARSSGWGPRQRVLQHDGLDDVGDVLERVEGALHRLDDVLPPQDLEGLELAAEQAGQDAPVDGVALALQPVDGLEVGLHALHRLEPRRAARVSSAHWTTRSACSFSSGRAVVMPVICMRCGHLEHVVDHVVELLGQGVDVLAVEGRDERRVRAAGGSCARSRRPGARRPPPCRAARGWWGRPACRGAGGRTPRRWRPSR